MQDTEFTVEEGRLYMLQTRNAKRARPGGRALRRRRRRGGPADRAQAIATIDAERLDSLLHPTFDPDAEFEVVARGVAASPGAAKGHIVFTAPRPPWRPPPRAPTVILVRPFTEAEDVAGFYAAQGHPDLARAARPRTPRSWRAAWAGPR